MEDGKIQTEAAWGSQSGLRIEAKQGELGREIELA